MSSAARTPGVIPQPGVAVSSGNKYISLYVLLAGIIGGLFLVLSLFLFCKFCRSKSQGTEGVGVGNGDSWALRDASFSIDHAEDEDSLRDREEVQIRGGSWSSNHSRYVAVEISTPPRSGAEVGNDLDEAPRSPRVATPSRLSDDVKSNIFLQRQKSFQNSDSSTVTCFAKPSSETAECEVAVEVHPGPSLKGGTAHKVGTAPLVRHASVSSISSSQVDSCKESWGRPEETEEEQLVPYRASSTDWTKLETNLDFWRKEHSKSQKEDSSHISKVRYNDTGSLEEVSVDNNCVDYFVEDEIMVHLETDRENMRQQYRRLWQLRATLEEDEDNKKPTTSEKQDSASTSAQPPPASSTDQSPDPEATTSHTTSFESNTEPLLDEASKIPPHLLLLPSYETRRQNYRNILNWRLRKLEARNARRHGGRQTSLDDNSFDSMDTVDTVDTEESSTDASRFDQATSFESTTATDVTDSPSTSEQQVHRLQLQQLRADSGYRSLENPRYPQPSSPPHRIPSLGESFEDVSEAEEGPSIGEIEIEGFQTQRQSCTESELDEGLGELRSPPHTTYDHLTWEGRRKPGGQPTSKKRRELCSMGSRVEYSRDYSVDEKSDALFREFSRCDMDSKRQHRLTAYRRLRGPYLYPKLSEPLDCGFTDDEVTLASVPIITVAADEDSSDHA